MDKLVLSDIQFHGHCGTTESERAVGQRLSLDLELYCEIGNYTSGRTGSNYPDYGEITKIVLDIGERERFTFLENLAERLAEVVLKQFPVHEVSVRLKKLKPPIPAIQGYFGVELRRCAGDFGKT